MLVFAAAASLLAAACGDAGESPAAAADRADAAETSRERRAAAGAELYAKYCALCHGADAKGYAADHAPSLVSETFLATASNAFIARAIRNGRPGSAMGGYGKTRRGPLSEEDIEAIITFLRWPGPSWAPPAPGGKSMGDAARGGAIFTDSCQPCHGTKEQRGDSVHLGNSELLDSASDAYLRYAITHGRPGTKMMSFSGTLDEQQIDDVVAFVRGWATGPANRAGTPPPEIPADLPLIINPKGPNAKLTLREGRFVPAEQVQAALAAKSRIVILDARTPGDWVQLRIPGAVPTPYHDMSRLDDLPKDGTWIVAYCACPHHASGAVVDELRKRSFPNTAVLDEGIFGWKKLGFPVEGEAPAGTEGPPRPPIGPKRLAPLRPR